MMLTCQVHKNATLNTYNYLGPKTFNDRINYIFNPINTAEPAIYHQFIYANTVMAINLQIKICILEP